MSETKNYTKTTYMVLCGLFAALMAICSFITIPLGFTPVPVNLATLGVFLTGGLLGRKYGTVSIAVYVLIGAAGVPVFAGFRGGVGVLAGPTGGYIVGYIAAVFLIGLLIERFPAKGGIGRIRQNDFSADEEWKETDSAHGGSGVGELFFYVIAMVAGLLVCYLLGTLWFMVSTNTGLWAALLSCVFPFLPGDALKIAAGALLVQRLRRML